MLYKVKGCTGSVVEGGEGVTYKSEQKQLSSLVSEEVWELIKYYGCFIAGGAVTSVFNGNDVNDLDVYFPSELSLLKALQDVLSGGESEYSLIFGNISARTLMFKDKHTQQEVQFMTFKYFKSPQEIFDTFDFTCCMGAYSCRTEKFILHNEFLKHNVQKYLKFNKGTAYPIMSLLRVDKYKSKGYDISKPEMLRIIMQCMNLEISSWEEAIDHMAGMYGYDMSDVFNQEEEFSFDKVIDQLGDITERDIKELQTFPTHCDFNFIVKEIVDFSGEMCKLEKPNFDNTKYYKCVNSKWQSPISSNRIVYEEGSIVNGGHYGIYVHYDINNPYHSTCNWVELELLDGGVKTTNNCFLGSGGETVLKGDVKVIRQFTYYGLGDEVHKLLTLKYPGYFED